MLNPTSTPMLILAALGSHNGAKTVLKLFSFLQYSTVSIVEAMNNWNKCREIMVVQSIIFKFVHLSLATPPRTPRISRLKSQILKPTFLS